MSGKNQADDQKTRTLEPRKSAAPEGCGVYLTINLIFPAEPVSISATAKPAPFTKP